MKVKILSLILGLALVVFLVGCAITTEKETSELEEGEQAFSRTTLPATSRLRFDDIAVPAGFKLLQDKSFVFQTVNTRVALLKYTGRANVQDLVDFYKEQMLLYNWQLLNVVEYEKSVLNFERSGQSCIVTIESKGIKKVITISVAPKAKGSIETQSQNK